MAKSLLRLEAIKLRKRGMSVVKIAQMLTISKSTVSHWTRDIILTVDQLENLRQSSLRGAELGRMRSAILQKTRRMELIEVSKNKGLEVLSLLQQREFLIAGVALYWGEGCKKKHGVELCNSDPGMIQFFILWLERCFKVKKEDIRCRVGINEIHAGREKIVREYWSNILEIPLSQFNNTSFKKVNNKKIYENFNEHFGTLSVRVVKPGNLYQEIIGLVAALPMAV